MFSSSSIIHDKKKKKVRLSDTEVSHPSPCQHVRKQESAFTQITLAHSGFAKNFRGSWTDTGGT